MRAERYFYIMRKGLFAILLLMISSVMIAQNVQLSIVDNAYEISYRIEEFSVEDTTLQYVEGDRMFSFLRFKGDDYDYLSDENAPVIPFISLNLRLPDDAEYAYVEVENENWKELDLPRLLMPTQEFLIDEKLPKYAYEENRICKTDGDKALCSVSPVYTTIGCKGVTVNIYPFEYRFEQSNEKQLVSRMNYIETTRIRVSYISGNADDLEEVNYSSLESLQENVDQLSALTFDNYKYLPVKSTATTSYRYLIITENKYRNALMPFVNYKDSLGFTMHMVSTSSTGETADSIRNYLVWYRRQHSDLRYVLLVGDINHIPFSKGENGSTSNPPTDVYYSCLDYYEIDHQSDLHPDVYVGRWIVDDIYYGSSIPDHQRKTLSHIINKSIKTEKKLYTVSNSSKHICLFSGSGSGENMFYNCIEDIRVDILGSYNYYINTVDGRDSYNSIMLQNVLNAVNYAWMVYYVGHSNTNVGFGSPYNLSTYEILNNINNYNNLFFPFAISIGCKMANVLDQPSGGFVNTWLTSVNGGVGLLASTVNTYYPPSLYYLKTVTKQLQGSPHPNIPWGKLCADGGSNYYHADKVLYRKRMYLKMICFGDPSLMINGNNISNPLHVTYHNSNKEKLDISPNEELAFPIDIYSSTGILISTYYNYQSFKEFKLPQGVYLICSHQNDENKVLKCFVP